MVLLVKLTFSKALGNAFLTGLIVWQSFIFLTFFGLF